MARNLIPYVGHLLDICVSNISQQTIFNVGHLLDVGHAVTPNLGQNFRPPEVAHFQPFSLKITLPAQIYKLYKYSLMMRRRESAPHVQHVQHVQHMSHGNGKAHG